MEKPSQKESSSGYLEYIPSEAEQKRLRRIINPRRGASQSVPGLSMKAGLAMGDDLFAQFGLHQYVGCVTAEMPSRPAPEVFKADETQKLTALFERWAPYVYERILPELEAPIQVFNKTSRLGWPEYTAPPNKLIALMPHFNRLARGDLDYYRAAMIIMNVRLQAEAKNKKRKFTFVGPDGVYKKEVDEHFRSVEIDGVGRRTGSRTRLVFNMPVPNLWKQVLDTAIHNVFLRYPTFHHDMHGGKILPVRGRLMCFDVKHFERHTAAVVRARGKHIIGGMYGKIVELFEGLPFVTPNDDWTGFECLYVDRANGFSDQFASGDSAVAPAQKEVFLCLYAEFVKQAFQVSEEEAINIVFRGGNDYLTIRNYGDDNAPSGDSSVLDDLFSFMKEYLTVELEDPQKFLGFCWYEGLGWRLSPESYLTKAYLNERRPFSNFRKYPFLGWVLKRQIFSKLGHPDVATKVYPAEDALLAKHGMPWLEIMKRGEQERVAAATRGRGQSDPNWVLGKDYMMTPEEKIATGEFVGLMPDQTAPILKQLLGAEWAKRLRW